MEAAQHQNSSSDLARLIGCFSEDELLELTGVTPGTLKAWRNRGTGPNHVLFGKNYLYRIADVEEYILSISDKNTSAIKASSMLM